MRKFHYDENSAVISGENFHERSIMRAGAAARLDALQSHRSAGRRRRYAIRQHVCGLRRARRPRMKTYLEGLTATHDGAPIFGPGTPKAVHPVVIRHPESGRKALYVNTDFTAYINDLPRLEGDRLLRFLIDHATNPQWIVRFRWRAHSIAFWG